MLIPQGAYDRAYLLHERSLPDTGVAAFAADRWASPSASFPCALTQPAKQAGGRRLDFESGNHDGFRLHVARSAPALTDGDRVTVTRLVLGQTLTVKVQVVDDQPPITHQRNTTYQVRELA